MSEAKMAVSVLLNARDKLTGSVSNAKRMTSRLGRTITRIGRNPGFQKIRHHITRTAGAAKRLGMRLGKIGAGFGVAAAGVTAALGHMTAKFASSADATAKMADQVGIGVEALQEWRFVAERQGVSQEKFNQSLGAFTKRVGEAQNGTGALTTQLKKSNPELLKQLQNAKSTSEALDLYLKAIGKAPTATQKAALASAGFSRAGLEMIRITRDGAANIDALRQRARDLGLVLDEKTARQAETFDDRLTDLQGSLTGVKNIMGAQLLPVFTKVMDQMTRWIVKNQDTVRQWAKQFAADLPDRLAALKQHFNEIVDAAGRFLDKAKPLAKTALHIADRFGRMNVAVAAVAAIIAAPILAPLASLTAALVGLSGTLVGLSARALPLVLGGVRALTAVLIANPIGATIAGIATAALLIYKYWGPIKAFASNVWGAVKGAVSGVWDWLTNLDWSAAGKKLIMTFVSGLKHAAGAVKDAVKGALSKARNLLPFSDAREGPLSDLTKSGTRLPSTFAGGVIKNQKALVGAVDKVMGAANERMNDRVVPFRPKARPGASDAVAPPRGPAGASSMLFGPSGQAVAAGGRGPQVGRVDVNAPITIHMGDHAAPEEVGQAVASHISNADLWGDIQDLPEESH